MIIRSTLSLLYLSFFSLCVSWLGLPKSIFQSATTTERWFLSLFLSFFLLHWLHFGWVIMPPMRWFKWQSSWQSEVGSKSTCCCCWVNSRVLWQSEFTNPLVAVAGWIPEFLGRVSNSFFTCCKCCWGGEFQSSLQSFQLLHLLQVLLSECQCLKYVNAQVFEIMNFWCSKSGQHPFIYSKM